MYVRTYVGTGTVLVRSPKSLKINIQIYSNITRLYEDSIDLRKPRIVRYIFVRELRDILSRKSTNIIQYSFLREKKLYHT